MSKYRIVERAPLTEYVPWDSREAAVQPRERRIELPFDAPALYDRVVTYTGLRFYAGSTEIFCELREHVLARLFIADREYHRLPGSMLGAKGLIDDELPLGSTENDPEFENGHAVFLPTLSPLIIPRGQYAMTCLELSEDSPHSFEELAQLGWYRITVYLVGQKTRDRV